MPDPSILSLSRGCTVILFGLTLLGSRPGLAADAGSIGPASNGSVADIIRLQQETVAVRAKIALETGQNTLARLTEQNRQLTGKTKGSSGLVVTRISCGDALCEAVLYDGIRAYTVKRGGLFNGLPVTAITERGVVLGAEHKAVNIPLDLGALTLQQRASSPVLEQPPSLPPLIGP